MTDLSTGIAGGLLVAAASSANLLVSGKITGLSGMATAMARYVTGAGTPSPYQLSFLSGVLAAGALARVALPAVFPSTTSLVGSGGLAVASLAGLLVGYGSKRGSGCTSGHGVCGIPRLSKRSLVATAMFMATGFITASLVRPAVLALAGIAPGATEPAVDAVAQVTGFPLAAAALAGLLSLAMLSKAIAKPTTPGSLAVELVSFGTGLTFGTGLALSGMTNPDVILQFLAPYGPAGWDLGVAAVFCAAVLTNLASFRLILARAKPICALKFDLPTRTAITADLAIGSAVFGVGWGIAGYCPGPGMMSFATGSPAVLAWLVGLFAGYA